MTQTVDAPAGRRPTWSEPHPGTRRELPELTDVTPATEPPVRPRRNRRRVVVQTFTAAVLAGITGVYATFIMWQSRIGPPQTFPDTADYQSVAAQPGWSRAFLAGRRPPLTPLLWKLTGTVDGFVTAQTVISIVAWAALAWVMYCIVGGRWRGLVCGVVVLGFASTDPITMWNRVILSETLALSFLAVLFAAAVVWARRPTFVRGVIFTFAAALFAYVRDSNILVVAGLAGSLLSVLLVTLGWRGIRAARRAVRRRRARALAARTPARDGIDRVAAPELYPVEGLAGAVTLWSGPGRAAKRQRSERRLRWTAWIGVIGVTVVSVTALGASAASHRYETNLRNVVAARVLPYPDRLAWWADQGMPQVPALAAAGLQHPSSCGNQKVVDSGIWREPRFAPAVTWLAANGRHVYAQWMREHPRYILDEPRQRPERATCNNGSLFGYAPADRYALESVTEVLYPHWPAMVALGAFAAVLAVVGALTWSRARRRRTVIGMLALLGGLGLVHMIVAWHSDGMESKRHGLEGNVQVRLAVMLLVLYVLMTVTRSRAAAPAAPAAPGDPPVRVVD